MASLYVRLPDDLHSKLRVIAALRSDSLNGTVLDAAEKYVREWEERNGELPRPPAEA
jgi:plasmid stability protein